MAAPMLPPGAATKPDRPVPSVWNHGQAVVLLSCSDQPAGGKTPSKSSLSAVTTSGTTVQSIDEVPLLATVSVSLAAVPTVTSRSTWAGLTVRSPLPPAAVTVSVTGTWTRSLAGSLLLTHSSAS